MAWPGLNTPNYESLIVVKLACNHDHHSMSDEDEVLLESLAREYEDCRVVGWHGGPHVMTTTYSNSTLPT